MALPSLVEFASEDFIIHDGRMLYRIRATKDMPWHGVKKGDLGGWVEHMGNISGRAWIGDEAKVYRSARVGDDAAVSGQAAVCGSARIEGKSKVYGSAMISGNVIVEDEAFVHGNARISGTSNVRGTSKVYGNAEVLDAARIVNNAVVCGNAVIRQKGVVGKNAWVSESAEVFGTARLGNWDAAQLTSLGFQSLETVECVAVGNTKFFDSARVLTGEFSGNVWVCGDVFITDPSFVASGDAIIF